MMLQRGGQWSVISGQKEVFAFSNLRFLTNMLILFH